MRKSKYFVPLLLFIIVIVACVLRFWQLGNVPLSLDWDEVSWGYNAYSILETGKDEYGKKLPIVIQSLNDYKPALYMYLVVPLIYVFGLTNAVVRFPNALFGVFSVFITYFLVKELFERRDIAILSSFLLAVSPWAIQFSRFAHEATTGLVFNLLMVLFFLKALKKPKFLVLSAFFTGVSIYTYQNEKLFVPLLGIVLLISFFKQFLKIPKKYIISSFLLGFAIVLPMFFYIITTPESLTRAKGTSFLNNPGGVLNQRFYPQRGLDDLKRGDLLGRVVDNRRVLYAKAIAGNYLSHFDPNFLFVTGEKIGRHVPPGMGHLYLIEFPFFLIGLYFLIFGKFKKSVKKFILLWIIITPIAASITWDVPNSGRTLNFLPSFQIVVAIGIVSFYLWLKNLKINNVFKYFIGGLICIVAIFNFIYYLNQYFVQYNYFNSEDWQYGYDQIIPTVQKLYPDYERIIVSNNRPMDESYIFFLYNLRYPPSEYQKNPNRNFDKFDFIDTKNFDWPNAFKNELIIIPATQVSSELSGNVIKTVQFLNGEDAISVVKGTKNKDKESE